MEIRAFTALIVFTSISQAAGAFIEVTTAPTPVMPYLTSQLTLQCLLKDTIQNVAGILVGRDVTSTAFPIPTTNTITPATDNVDFITSMSIFKEGHGEVATMSIYTPATMISHLNNATVSGNVKGSVTSSSGVRGHLEIEWLHPMDDVQGSYTCEIYALTTEGHGVSFHQTVQVKIKEASTVDILKQMQYLELSNLEMRALISQQDSVIAGQQTQLSNQQKENTDLKHQLMMLNASDLHLESGEVNCGGGALGDGSNTTRSSQYDVTFDRPYAVPPAVMLSVQALVGHEQHDDVYYDINQVGVTTTGFSIQCLAKEASQLKLLDVQWMSFTK